MSFNCFSIFTLTFSTEFQSPQLIDVSLINRSILTNISPLLELFAIVTNDFLFSQFFQGTPLTKFIRFLKIWSFSSSTSGNDAEDEEKLRFPANFVFGAATAAYQIEGAWNVSGTSIEFKFLPSNLWIFLIFFFFGSRWKHRQRRKYLGSVGPRASRSHLQRWHGRRCCELLLPL